MPASTAAARATGPATAVNVLVAVAMAVAMPIAVVVAAIVAVPAARLVVATRVRVPRDVARPTRVRLLPVVAILAQDPDPDPLDAGLSLSKFCS